MATLVAWSSLNYREGMSNEQLCKLDLHSHHPCGLSFSCNEGIPMDLEKITKAMNFTAELMREEGCSVAEASSMFARFGYLLVQENYGDSKADEWLQKIAVVGQQDGGRRQSGDRTIN
ncbi:MAG: hypothetical protein JJT85_11090 [Chromatiales bacterium]|nr:hypothetical protein [Chromatiales bacterium]